MKTLFDKIAPDYEFVPYDKLPKNRLVAIDFENDPDTLEPEIISIAWDGGKATYDILTAPDIRDNIFNFLDQCSGVIAHNILHELKVLRKWGYNVYNLRGKIEDTMPMLHVINTENPLGLKETSHLVGKQLKHWNKDMRQDKEGYMEYCQEDSVTCLLMYSHLLPQVKELGCMIAYKMEIDLVWVVFDMENTGIRVDVPKILQLRKQTKEKLEVLEKQMALIAGKVINFASTPQLSSLLFEDFAVPKKKEYYTPNGTLSVAEAIIEDIVKTESNPKVAISFCELVLKFKEHDKFLNTYLSDKFLSHVGADGRLRPRAFSLGTRTSRFAYYDPNLQQTPKRGENVVFRTAYIPKEGYKFVRVDLSQAEYRLLAHFCQDEKLIDAYMRGMDIHEATGKLMGVDRDKGKTLNFAIVYGLSVTNLAKRLRITVEEASNLLKTYFEKFPKIRLWKEAVVKYVRATREIRLMSGRIRRVDQYDFVDNIAVNTPIQGGVAEIIKLAMIKCHKEFFGTDVKLILQVHDELLFEVPEAIAEETAAKIKYIMENTHKLSVPIVADPEILSAWKEVENAE